MTFRIDKVYGSFGGVVSWKVPHIFGFNGMLLNAVVCFYQESKACFRLEGRRASGSL